MVHHVASKNVLETAVDLQLGIVLGRKESRSPWPIWWWGTLCFPPNPCARAGVAVLQGCPPHGHAPRSSPQQKQQCCCCPSLYSALRPLLPFEDSPLFGLLTYFRGGCLSSFLNFYGRHVVKENPEKLFARKRHRSPLVSIMQLWAALPFIWSASNT